MTNPESRIEEGIEARIELGARYSDTFNRLRHMSDAEAGRLANSAGFEAAYLHERRHSCTCYPRGFISTPRAEKERIKAEHIAAGVHELMCPLGKPRRDYEPWFFGLRGEERAPSYTQQSARRDEEWERLE